MKVYGALRIFPRMRNGKYVANSVGSVFVEKVGTRRECEEFCKTAAKPLLVLGEFKTIKKWRKDGKCEVSE